MRALELDFARSRPASPFAGPLLFALAVAALTAGFGSWRELSAAVRHKEARLAAAAPARPAPQFTAEELADARSGIESLATPWNRLFSALEGAANARVALLALEPDPRAGTVRIDAEAKDYLAALTYVERLGSSGRLSHVHLVRHEVHGEAAGRPVTFTVSAAWKEPER